MQSHMQCMQLPLCCWHSVADVDECYLQQLLVVLLTIPGRTACMERAISSGTATCNMTMPV